MFSLSCHQLSPQPHRPPSKSAPSPGRRVRLPGPPLTPPPSSRPPPPFCFNLLPSGWRGQNASVSVIAALDGISWISSGSVLVLSVPDSTDFVLTLCYSSSSQWQLFMEEQVLHIQAPSTLERFVKFYATLMLPKVVRLVSFNYNKLNYNHTNGPDCSIRFIIHVIKGVWDCLPILERHIIQNRPSHRELQFRE